MVIEEIHGHSCIMQEVLARCFVPKQSLHRINGLLVARQYHAVWQKGASPGALHLDLTSI